jgi:RNA polymerase sigma-70 factor (ECF subfamily)
MKEILLKGVSDRELVEKTLKGSEKAFREIVIRYNRIIYAAARSVLGGSDDLDDTVQDILIKIYRGLPGYKGKSLLSTWIYRIARNEALNKVGKRRAETVDIDQIYDLASKDESPETVYGRKLDAIRLEKCIGRLDRKYREIIELRYIADKSYSEISSILNLPIGTVKTNIHRARIMLRELLKENTISLVAGSEEQSEL